MAEDTDPCWQPTSKQLDPFLNMHPHSKDADKKGLKEGKLIMDNWELAHSLEENKKYLNNCLKKNSMDVTVEVTHFENWGKTQESLLLHAKPKKRNEISCLVKAASDQKPEPIKVGAGGAYHSWSPMFPNPGGLLINTCDLELDSPLASEQNGRFYLHTLEDGRKVVTISPGVTVAELMKFFLQRDVCFESDLILPTATYGGILSGGCHGTGKDQTSMSDWIVSLTFVDGKGEIKTISETSNKSHLKAAQANLGLFGVVVEYTLEVKDMSLCRVQNNFKMKLMDAVDPPGTFGAIKTEKLGKLLKDTWSFELFWFPFTGILDWIMESLPTKDLASINIDDLPKKPEQVSTGFNENLQEVVAPTIAEQGSEKSEIGGANLVEEQFIQIQQETYLSEATLPTSKLTMPADLDEEISKESILHMSGIIENLEVSSSTGQLTFREDFKFDTERLQQVQSSMNMLKSQYTMMRFWPIPIKRIIEVFLRWLSTEAAKCLDKHPITLPSGFFPKLVGALWLPYMDNIWIRAIDKRADVTNKSLSREPGVPLWTKALDLAVHKGGNNILAPALHKYPDLTPLTLGLGYQALKFQYGELQRDEIVKTPWAVHYRDAIDFMPVTDMEFAFPIKLSEPTLAVKAIHAVVNITKEFAIKGLFSKGSNEGKPNRFPLTLCMEMRVIKKSESLLCPASMWPADDVAEHVAYIEVLSTADTPGYQEYFKAIAENWMSLGGIPHWQKQWAFLGDPSNFADNTSLPIYEHIKTKCEKNLKAFEAIRKKYDSRRIFMNDTMAKIFK